MWTLRSCWILSSALLFGGCSDGGSDIVPAGPDVKRIALVATPASGKIGSEISIRHSSFVASGSYNVTFPGADDFIVGRSDSSGLKFIVPFGATAGPITVKVGDTTGVTQPFVVTEPSDTSRFTVLPYDVTPLVTPGSAAVVDFQGSPRTWSADVRGDTIHLSLAYSAGESWKEAHLLLIHAGSNQLPVLARAWTVMRPDYPGIVVDTIQAGILKVQDWDTSAVMSGKFFGRPSMRHFLNGTLTFWIDRRH
jgi:hypothetical protein